MVEVVVDVRVGFHETETHTLGADVEIRLALVRSLDFDACRQQRDCRVERRHPQRNVLQRSPLARAVGRKEREFAVAGVRADERELVGPVDHVHPEMLRDKSHGGVALREPERDMVELRRIHALDVTRSDLGYAADYLRRSTARCSCAFVMRERPSIPIRFASL